MGGGRSSSVNIVHRYPLNLSMLRITDRIILFSPRRESEVEEVRTLPPLSCRDAHGPTGSFWHRHWDEEPFRFFFGHARRYSLAAPHHQTTHQPKGKVPTVASLQQKHPPQVFSKGSACFLLLRPSLGKMSSLWSALTGQKSNQNSSSQQSNAPAPTTTPTPTTTFSSPAFDPSSAQGVDSFLNSSTFADPSQLHPLAGLDKDALDYITLEDSALSDLPGGQSVLPSRGFTDDLCYGTGVTYLSALTIGGAWGMQEGLRRSAGQAPKLRLNSTLNAITRRGPFLGNSAGVVAIVYNCFNSYIGSVRGKHDAGNSVLAGVLSGMLFKSTRGLRPMAISGGIVGGVALAWAVSLFRRCALPAARMLIV